MRILVIAGDSRLAHLTAATMAVRLSCATTIEVATTPDNCAEAVDNYLAVINAFQEASASLETLASAIANLANKAQPIDYYGENFRNPEAIAPTLRVIKNPRLRPCRSSGATLKERDYG